MANLKIIKASAGSGKTHTLTSEYLRLLTLRERAYRNILAVTFTNKATDEMKRRVVETLYRDSFKNLRSRERLIEILHDYSSFSISTIDRFFQQTMRAFAREIGRNSAYGVELNQDNVIKQAIDNMIMSLDKPENTLLLEWLTQLSMDSVDRGDGWYFKNSLINLSGEIFKESYRLKRGSLPDDGVFKKELSEYKEMLLSVIKRFTDELRRIGDEACKVVERHSLTFEDYTGGKRSPFKNFLRAASGEVYQLSDTFLKLPDNPSGWSSKETQKRNPSLFKAIEDTYYEGLNDKVKELINHYENASDYYTASVILENIYTLGILLDVERYIQEYTRENNLVLIPETTELLNRIIDGSDTPFIYEKIGTRIDHFMLDEFQDTSMMQWQNFKPLILNSLASGNDNLIVGDVKQSIYRWRGSDWSLLNSGLYSDLPDGAYTDITKSENWRSCSQIIDFNNRFFEFMAKSCDNIVGEESGNVYKDVVQKISERPRDSAGHVLVKFTENPDDYLPQLIEQYISNGYSLSDITILVRKNIEGRNVVELLINKGYQVISDEALFISSSASVMRVITVLKYLNSPENAINNTIAKHYSIDPLYAGEIAHLPLYELCEELIKRESKNRSLSESLFLQAFLDNVLDYTRDKRADIASFLQWWDDKGYKSCIPAPDGQNAIRVMTIHKSKGLGIPVVILPYFSFSLDHEPSHAPVIWCEPDRAPFNSIPLLPVKYKKEMGNTIFANDYHAEKQRIFIDNQNIAYVAFTRAERELAIMSPLPEKENNSVSSVLYNFLKDSLNSDSEVHFGEWSNSPQNLKRSQNEYKLCDIQSYEIGDRLKLTLRGEEYYNESSKRGYGVIMHEIMASVITMDDLEKAVDGAVIKGLIYPEQRAELVLKMRSFLDSVKDRHWFDGSYKVLNELEIIEPGGKISRPDRVLQGGEVYVIDFKFGKRKESSHVNQVKRYTNLLRSMGKVFVKGYVWYPENGEIIEVVL